MKPGDFADAKGQVYAHLLSIPGVRENVMAQIVDVTERHLRAAQARGANLKVYFADSLPPMKYAKNSRSIYLCTTSW